MTGVHTDPGQRLIAKKSVGPGHTPSIGLRHPSFKRKVPESAVRSVGPGQSDNTVSAAVDRWAKRGGGWGVGVEGGGAGS